MYSCDMGVEWTCISKCSGAVGAAVSEWLHCNMLVVEKALVICLPGKPSGALECLGFVVGAIPHCVEVLQEVPTSC